MSQPTLLAKKLQIKPNHRVLLVGAPDGLAAALDPLPEGATVATSARGEFDAVLLFVRRSDDLAKSASKAIRAAGDEGVLWIAYPKRTSGMETDLTRDVGWQPVVDAGWGPVAQVAIDDTWSALRFKPEAAVRRKSASAAAQRTPASARGPRPKQAATVAPPEDLAVALRSHAAAQATWESLAPSHRREYAGWIEEAKKPDTRARRVEKAIEMMTAGVKDRNEKYKR